jgi:hypothetical protein
MYVTSGEGMKRKIHYVAPPSNMIDDEMN